MSILDRRTAMLGGAVSVLFSNSVSAATARKDTGYYVNAEIKSTQRRAARARCAICPCRLPRHLAKSQDAWSIP